VLNLSGAIRSPPLSLRNHSMLFGKPPDCGGQPMAMICAADAGVGAGTGAGNCVSTDLWGTSFGPPRGARPKRERHVPSQHAACVQRRPPKTEGGISQAVHRRRCAYVCPARCQTSSASPRNRTQASRPFKRRPCPSFGRARRSRLLDRAAGRGAIDAGEPLLTTALSTSRDPTTRSLARDLMCS
jgi:hypothetical protein